MDDDTKVGTSPPHRRMPGDLTGAFRRVGPPPPSAPPITVRVEEVPQVGDGLRRAGKGRRAVGGIVVVLVLILAASAAVVWMRSSVSDAPPASAAVPADPVTSAVPSPSVALQPSASLPPSVSPQPSASASLQPSASASLPPSVSPQPSAAGKANPSGADLALRGVATASGIEARAWDAEFAIDGDPVSRWSSAFTDRQWISVDLRQRWQLTKVTLVWEASYGRDYRIDTSLDGTTWTTLWSTTAGHGGTVTVPAKGTVARYVRMFGTRRISTYGYSLFEFEVR
jgi:hypothetical protein